MQNEPSLIRRYLFRLIGSGFSGMAGLIIHAIVPRALGPHVYGDFSFLTLFFSRLINLFGMGTSNAFYIKLSKRPRETELIVFYTYLTVLLSGFVILVIGFIYFLNLQNYFWPQQKWKFILLACLWVLLMHYSNTLNQIIDAFALTIKAEKRRLVQKILSLTLIFLLYTFGKLNLTTYFFQQYTIFVFLCVAWILLLRSNISGIFKNTKITWFKISCYAKEFKVFCSPLVSYTVVTFFIVIFDRWWLQKYAGSIEQGYFGFSYRIGAICFLFAGALTQLITREFSVAIERKDHQAVATLFRRYVPAIYTIVVYFSCFISVHSGAVTTLMGGKEYVGAVLPVLLMSLYPIHQTYGQLGGSIYFATERTSLYRNIGIFMGLVGIPATFFLVGPDKYFGLNAGATGIAIKVLFVQFILVNIQLYYNAKFLKIKFMYYLVHQLSVLCVFFISALLVKELIDTFISHVNILTNLLFSGVLYTILIVITLFLFPYLLGFSNRKEYKVILSNFKIF